MRTDKLLVVELYDIMNEDGTNDDIFNESLVGGVIDILCDLLESYG